MKKSLLFATTVITSTFIFLTGCGSSDSASKSYTASYSMETFSQLPNVNFFPGEMNLPLMMQSQNQVFTDYELIVTGDKYELIGTSYTGNPENKEKYVVGDDSAIAITATIDATGTISESTDTTITISVPESITYSIPAEKCDSIALQMASIITLNTPDAETPTGTWTSADFPELIDSIPSVTFTINENGTIETWE